VHAHIIGYWLAWGCFWPLICLSYQVRPCGNYSPPFNFRHWVWRESSNLTEIVSILYPESHRNYLNFRP
jgi:hypothetical protein